MHYYPTSIPNLAVSIRFKDQSDGRVKAVGIAINAETDENLSELGQYTSKAVSRNRKIAAINIVCSEFEKRYQEKYGLGPAEASDMQRAFSLVKKTVLVDHGKLYPRWESQSTNEAALKFFERNTLPLLLPYANKLNRPFLPSDRDTIIDQLREKCIRHSGDSQNSVEDVLRRHLREADIIYACIRDQDERLPEFRLTPTDFFAGTHKAEQVKYLPREAITVFYKNLSQKIPQNPRKVFFAVLVVYGLRPSEAAARKPSDLHFQETYCTLEVTSQERNGMLDSHLKNKYSRRVVVISYWGSKLLQQCCELIGDDYPHGDKAMNLSEDCASWVKNQLYAAGITPSLISALSADVEKSDKDDGDVTSKKIACYVLRRNFTTIARTVMGLSLYETDRLLGHAPNGSRKKGGIQMYCPDMNSYATQKTLAEKMERYIFDPEISLNPICKPFALTVGKKHVLTEFSEYVFTATGPCTVELNIIAAEAGENIEIGFPSESTQTLQAHSSPKDWQRHSRLVIGDTTAC